MKPETVISLLALNNSLLEKCFIEMAIVDSAQAQLYSEIARKYRENKALLNNLEVKSGLLLEPETRQCFENFVREMTTKILSQDFSKKELQAPVDLVRPKFEMVASEKKPSIPVVAVVASSEDNKIVAIRSQKKGYTKSARTNLTVTFENGPFIHRPTARDAFVEALEFMGIEKVRALGIKACGEPLVSETQSKNPRYASQQPRSGKYYIFTYTATEKKKSYIEDIAGKLGIKVRVEITVEKQS